MPTFWTIQTREKWKEAQRLGYLIADEKYIWEEFIEPYQWMMGQMKKRLPNYAGEYPIWLWTRRPDLRGRAHLGKGEKGVLLKVELDEQDVLLSHFQAWHIVLSRSYFELEINEEEPEYNKDEIEKSWEMIFELDILEQHPNWKSILEKNGVQAVTGKITIANINFVKDFIAR